MSKATETVVAPEATQKARRPLYVMVLTSNASGETTHKKVVDMYLYGTRNWLQDHQWWAMHNGHSVETRAATADEVTEYMTKQREALAKKFNGDLPLKGAC